MSYKKDNLHYYVSAGMDLMPLHPWNKRINQKERGKTPVHNDWPINNYKNNDLVKWISSGLNIGVRLRDVDLIVDIDPRNFTGDVDTYAAVADLFNFLDFDDMIHDCPTVKTGSGGYHVYFKLPQGVSSKRIKTSLESIPGMDLKKKGGYVVAAGSRHPNGNYYEWVNACEPITLSDCDLKRLTREEKNNSGYSSGKGALNGTQLQELILDKLEVTDYSDNDSWFPILCACHHITDGDGIEEFLEWSLGDLEYSDCENQIRNRWESLHSDDSSYKAGTLINELEKSGEETNKLRAVLQFSEFNCLDVDDDESEEYEMINRAKQIARDIDYGDIYQSSSDDEECEMGVEGRATIAVNDLSQNPSDEELAKCLRLIKSAGVFESTRAIETLAKKIKMSKATITKLIKEMDEKLCDDLSLLLSRKTLEIVFNKGKHLTCTPNGQLYGYHKTHWIKIGEAFMAKLTQNTLHELKQRLDIKAPELTIINQATRLSYIECATLIDKIHSTELPKPIINCKNGELWITKQGEHKLKPHTYKSYLTSCLNVNYEPGSECPLFMRTLKEIFANFDDCDDMIRHMGELMGYTIQPYKNIASWWLFRGPGGDGKSTLLKIMGGILADAQLMTTIKLLSAGSTEGYNHAIVSLVGKLSVIIEEVPSGYMLKDAGVKLLSENTKMEANPKMRDAFDFVYAGNLILCSNGYPATRDLSHGMFRRANIIPFNQRFDADGREDIDRAADILSDPKEMSGVLNFMLEGLARLRKRGKFKVPASCVAAKEEWLGEANNVIKFIDQTIIKTGNADDLVGELSSIYEFHYNTWCQSNDIDERLRKRKMQFKRDLISMGFVAEESSRGVVKIYGGRLKEESASEGSEEIDDWLK